jgi:hypothetical protein
MRLVARTTLMLVALAVATDVHAQSMLAMPPPDLQGGYIMQPGQDLYWAPQAAYPDGQGPPGYAYPYYAPGPGGYPRAAPQAARNSDEPDLYVDLGFVLLWQENTFSNGSTLDFDPAAGPRVLIGIRPTQDNAFEIEYFGSFGNEIDQRFRTGGIPNFLIGLQYTSDLQNAEVNWIHWWDQFALLGGFRFVQVDENFKTTLLNFPGQHSLNTEATNNLFGGQIGIRVRQLCGKLFFVETVKAGLFDNSASGKETSSSQSYLFYRRTGGNFTAFVGDVNVSVGYWLSELWAVRARYTAMWINGVALAPDQVDFLFGGLKHNESAFLQGLSVGLEARF